MLIRQAFQTFLQLQSEADRLTADVAPQPAGAAAAAAWPMDHTVHLPDALDWVIDWRWFAE